MEVDVTLSIAESTTIPDVESLVDTSIYGCAEDLAVDVYEAACQHIENAFYGKYELDGSVDYDSEAVRAWAYKAAGEWWEVNGGEDEE